MSDVAPRFDEARLAALAARLALAPHELLALAGRFAARTDAPLDGERLDADIARLRAAPRETANAAALLRLGHGAYPPDDIDQALAWIWTHADATGT